MFLIISITIRIECSHAYHQPRHLPWKALPQSWLNWLFWNIRRIWSSRWCFKGKLSLIVLNHCLQMQNTWFCFHRNFILPKFPPYPIQASSYNPIRTETFGWRKNSNSILKWVWSIRCPGCVFSQVAWCARLIHCAREFEPAFLLANHRV